MELQFTKEIKNNWLEALKSGKYEQIDGRLHRGDNRYCCLGVLCVSANIDNIGEHGASKHGYGIFEELLGKENSNKLWKTNDSSCNAGFKDYSQVLPLIEQLPTID